MNMIVNTARKNLKMRSCIRATHVVVLYVATFLLNIHTAFKIILNLPMKNYIVIIALKIFPQIRRHETPQKSCIRCKHCHEWFNTLKEIDNHNKSCFKCENCYNLFSSKRQLKQHLNRKLEEGEENC